MITGEFDEEILADLINEGYEGNALLNKFKEIRAKVSRRNGENAE